MDSILTSVKKMLGIEPEYTHFDPDIIFNVNSVFMTLNQLGVGPSTCFLITSDAEKWSDFLGVKENLEAVKMYMYIKVRVLFDPPSSSFVLDAMNRQASEIEWRLNAQVENEGVIVE